MAARAETVTILFTDLVGSTELLQRAGDEQAQRIFKAHHRLLREAVEAHGGHEVKWLGDGLMVAFDSAQEAVRCAIAMQQASRRPAAGERLEIRAGLNVGEALVDESDYFGTPVVVARRLCDRAGSGQIFASDIVVRLLDGRGADIEANDLGPLELKGITNAVPAVEIVYQHDPMALLRKLPFVGRQAEYETLLKKLAEANNGRGSIVLLAGEPGIGKTRLTEEFCEHASSGATIVRGNCYEGDVAAPFGPWLEALRSLIEQLPDEQLREALADGAPDIASMMPEVRRRLPDLEEAPRLDPESERARLFDSIGSFLRNAAQSRPLVIFLDDLHWCDKPSLLLLELIARGIADRRIVIVGAYRDVEVDRVHPLAQTLAALRRMENHERIAIRGFTEQSVYDLLYAIEPSEQAEAARRALAGVLHAEAEGNPFFIREVLNNLVETGRLAQQDGAWMGAVASIEEMDIPEGIKEAIGRRLSRLSEGCNKMLQRASAMASGFTWDELRAICDDPEGDLLDALDEALGSQLIEERSKLSYAFTHALIRQTLYEELSTPRRVLLHRQIGEALEKLYAANTEPHVAELARHFYQSAPGGDVEKAIDYAKRAGDRAVAAVAYEEAARLYQMALQALDFQDKPDEGLRCELLLALGDAQWKASGADVTDVYLRAADAAQAAKAPELLARASLGSSQLGPSPDERLVPLLQEALSGLGRDDSALRARVLASLAFQPSFPATAEERESLGREAIEVARRVGDNAALAFALVARHSALWRFWEFEPGDIEERLALANETVRVAEESGDKALALACHCNCLQDLVWLGDIAGADVELEAHGRLAGELRERVQLWHTAALRAMRALFDGRFEEGERLVQEASAMGQQMHFPGGGPVAAFAVQLLLLRKEQGRLGELETILKGFVEQDPRDCFRRAALAFVYSELGHEREARSQLEELSAAGFADVPRDNNWMITLALLADVCAFLSDSHSAQALYELLLPYGGRNVSILGAVVCYGSAWRYLGILATTMGRWEEAAPHFEEALAANARMGARPWVAHTQHDYASMLLARAAPGDRERAVALLQEALEAAERMGMAKVAADAERLLAESNPSN